MRTAWRELAVGEGARRHFGAIAIELEVTGTHTGPMQTPQGTLPATGKKVVWDSCDYVRVRVGSSPRAAAEPCRRG